MKRRIGNGTNTALLQTMLSCIKEVFICLRPTKPRLEPCHLRYHYPPHLSPWWNLPDAQIRESRVVNVDADTAEVAKRLLSNILEDIKERVYHKFGVTIVRGAQWSIKETFMSKCEHLTDF